MLSGKCDKRCGCDQHEGNFRITKKYERRRTDTRSKAEIQRIEDKHQLILRVYSLTYGKTGKAWHKILGS